MSQTQLASMFIGVSQETETDEQRRRKKGAIIHVLDKQTDDIIETLNSAKGDYTDAQKTDNLNNENTFDFTALKKFDVLAERNRLLVEDVDGFFSEYIINFTDQYKRNAKEVRSSGSFVDLQKSKVIEPQRLEGQTPQTAVQFALDGTEYLVGDIDFVNIRTITIEEHTNPYALLKQIASTFDLELRFRVEVRGNQIIGRYVDLKKYLGHFDGKEIVFGKDLVGIRRIEDSDNIVTALLGIGPEREDGTRLTVLVESEEARQRWGRNGQHLISVYEPESTDQDMTEARLRTLTENELEKRIDASVRYEGEAVSLEKVFGRQHEQIRLGMTVRIKDEGYTPPLYLEARISETIENPATGEITGFKIGDFIEYRREDLEKQVKALRSLLAQKVSEAQLESFAEKKIPVQPTPPLDPVEGDKWLNTSTPIPILMVRENDEWVKAAPTEAHDIGAASEDEALIINTDYDGMEWTGNKFIFTVRVPDGEKRMTLDDGKIKFEKMDKNTVVQSATEYSSDGIEYQGSLMYPTFLISGPTTFDGLVTFSNAIRVNQIINGTITRIILDIAANSGNGVPNYILGGTHIDSIVSYNFGLRLVLWGVPSNAIVSTYYDVRSSNGLVIGGTNVDPFIYPRGLSTELIELGIKTNAPASSHVPFDNVTAGMLRIEIAW